MNESTKPSRPYVTARKIAWCILLVGIAWFIQASPKKTLEFFDAATRDREAIHKRTMQKYETLDPVKAAQSRRLDEDEFCRRKMDRIALIHDLTNDPKQVHAERSSIMDGSYTPSKRTHETLMQNDDTYRDLSEDFEKLRSEIKADKDLWAADTSLVKEAKADSGFRMEVFQMEIDRLILRQFQARLFWWEVR